MRNTGTGYSRMLLHDTMLNKDIFRTGTSDTPLCKCGKADESVKHFLLYTARATEARKVIIVIYSKQVSTCDFTGVSMSGFTSWVVTWMQPCALEAVNGKKKRKQDPNGKLQKIRTQSHVELQTNLYGARKGTYRKKNSYLVCMREHLVGTR